MSVNICTNNLHEHFVPGNGSLVYHVQWTCVQVQGGVIYVGVLITSQIHLNSLRAVCVSICGFHLHVRLYCYIVSLFAMSTYQLALCRQVTKPSLVIHSAYSHFYCCWLFNQAASYSLRRFSQGSGTCGSKTVHIVDTCAVYPLSSCRPKQSHLLPLNHFGCYWSCDQRKACQCK